MPRARKHEPRLTGAQLRAARGLLNLSAEELAKETKLSLKTIRRAEQVHDAVPITSANAELIIAILEGRGVRFLEPDADGVGVRLISALPPRFGGQKDHQ
jgi:transcriptional regulator with XRE-family HTH domain